MFSQLDDDKYCKSGRSDPIQKYTEALGLSQQFINKAVNTGAWSLVFTTVGCMVIGTIMWFDGLEHLLNGASLILEIAGLVMVRYKISARKSVNGISGMTMIMYAVVYAVRIWLGFPASWSLSDMSMDGIFTIIPLLLVCDMLKSIFVTYRSSYEAEWDILQAKYLIPGCIVTALLIRPQFHFWTTSYSLVWSSCLYADVLALMPQVVMMSRSGGKISAPIAHFVAATFLSRVEDLWDSLMYHQSQINADDLFSYRMIIFVQVMHLLLVADFMYYYMKARAAGKVEDMQMGQIEV